jgi:hypothetical protein
MVFEFGDSKGFNFNFLRFTEKENTREKERGRGEERSSLASTWD